LLNGAQRIPSYQRAGVLRQMRRGSNRAAERMRGGLDAVCHAELIWAAVMTDADSHQNLPQARLATFATTHWSQVLAAGRLESPEAPAALAELCRIYWYPLYAYVRRHGHAPHDAQDLTQEFFARLLARRDLTSVSPDKGRFRSFLLAAMNHFLVNEWKRARRLKRGGGKPLFSLDDSTAEVRYAAEPRHELTADRIYERRWAMTLLEQTLASLKVQQDAVGKGALFARLEVYLVAPDNGPAYALLGRDLGMSEDAVKMAVSRLRRRYREVLRAQIAQTVASPAEVDAELRHLLSVLSS